MSKKIIATVVAFVVSFLSMPVCAMQEPVSPSSEVSASTPRTDVSSSDTSLTQELVIPKVPKNDLAWSDEEGVVPFAPGENSWGSVATRKPVWGQASQQGDKEKRQDVRAEASLGVPGEAKVSPTLRQIQEQALGEIERRQAATMLAKAVAIIQRDQENSGFSESK